MRPTIRKHMAKIAMTALSVEEERAAERLPHKVSIS